MISSSNKLIRIESLDKFNENIISEIFFNNSFISSSLPITLRMILSKCKLGICLWEKIFSWSFQRVSFESTKPIILFSKILLVIFPITPYPYIKYLSLLFFKSCK